jgi:glycosyltransferase involved in cell wall biosynthesis
VVYTETQARELREVMPDLAITAAPNALYRADAMRAATSEHPTDILCVGRLVAEKKPMLLLEAFARCVTRLPTDTRLVFVGEGGHRQRLEARISQLKLEHCVTLRGHVSDFEMLHDLYGNAVVSVSPGYVGLSITQSFSFGVPMIIARNEPHAPEIEAAVDGVNSLSFDENDPEALSDALIKVFQQRERWLSARTAIADECRRNYSIEVMAERLLDAACPDCTPPQH